MKPLLAVLFLAALLIVPAQAAQRHFWELKSPTHGQTYAYGSERHRAWVMRGSDNHLALKIEFTNDPHVDRLSPREYDDFVFDFPGVTSRDGRTFYYHAPDGRSIPVATRNGGFLGIDEVHLLPSSDIWIDSPHGYLTISLLVFDHVEH